MPDCRTRRAWRYTAVEPRAALLVSPRAPTPVGDCGRPRGRDPCRSSSPSVGGSVLRGPGSRRRPRRRHDPAVPRERAAGLAIRLRAPNPPPDAATSPARDRFGYRRRRPPRPHCRGCLRRPRLASHGAWQPAADAPQAASPDARRLAADRHRSGPRRAIRRRHHERILRSGGGRRRSRTAARARSFGCGTGRIASYRHHRDCPPHPPARPAIGLTQSVYGTRSSVCD